MIRLAIDGLGGEAMVSEGPSAMAEFLMDCPRVELSVATDAAHFAELKSRASVVLIVVDFPCEG